MADKKLKEVVLEFGRNSELVTIPAEHIDVSMINEIDGDFLYTDKQGNTCIGHFLEPYILVINRTFDDIERICQHDIKYVDCKYTDGTTEYYRVSFNYHKCDRNAYQHTKVNKHGDLFLAVSKCADILDVLYPDEVINKDDYVLSLSSPISTERKSLSACYVWSMSRYGRYI